MKSQFLSFSPVLSTRTCPFPGCASHGRSPKSRRPVRYGFYLRKEDGRRIQRFRCQSCRRCFSRATLHPCFRQRRRLLNYKLGQLLSSNVSQRRCARILGCSPMTVASRLCLFGSYAKRQLQAACYDGTLELQMDELETFEHTKLKPLSVPLAVDAKTRKIIAFEVAPMPAKGLLVHRSLKKYGYRRDGRPEALANLFKSVAIQCGSLTLVRSDSNPHYPAHVKRWLPEVPHKQEIGRDSSLGGQGELKKIRFDPIFSLNHTCAMLRANMSRLIRKTWCTTKKPERLAHHLALYAWYHNTVLTQQPLPSTLS